MSQTEATKKIAQCCVGYGSGGGVHDPSCGTMAGTEKRSLVIKDERSIFRFIVNDHNKVKNLNLQFNNTSNKEERNKIAANIIKEISTHSFLEETLLYPLLDAKLNAEGLNIHEHSIQEHQKVKNLLYKLDTNFDPSSETFVATLNEAMKYLNEHIDEEENVVLPKLQGKLSLQEEIDHGESWENRLKLGVHPTHPHPSAPTTEPLATMAAMSAKPLDIARDAARFGSEKAKETMGTTTAQQTETQTTTTQK